MKQKITRVTITGTIYNLFLNLLITPEEELSNTFYFTCESIPESIRKRVGNQYYIPQMHGIKRLRMFNYLIHFRFLNYLFFPFLSTARIYAQDHLPFSPYIIGNRKYAFTEDAPGIFEVIKTMKFVREAWEMRDQILSKPNLKGRIINPLAYGIFANNEYCDEVVITKPFIPDYVKGKKISLVDINQQWQLASEKKKKYILQIFDITQEDIKNLQSRKVIVFTQPFFDDGDVSTIEEQIEVYNKVISTYNINDVIIKTHPREKTDYEKYIPGIKVFNKPVPFQLLTAMGLQFEEAATVCSSSVFSFPYPIRVNWVGAKIHPGILKEYGDFIPEQLKSNQ